MNYGKWEDDSEIHHKKIDLKAQGSSPPSSSAVMLVDGDESSEIDLCSDEPTFRVLVCGKTIISS